MAELKGGTTIGGYTALHSGLKESYLSGNLTLGGNIKLGVLGEIQSSYNNAYIIRDFNNGNITISAAGSSLYLGYNNTTRVNLSTALYAGTSSNKIADTDGTLYFQGNNLDNRYLRFGTDEYIGLDLVGNTSYPRMAALNSGATTPDWIRVGSSSGRGLLPYSDGVGNLGASGWNFNQVWANNFYEGGSTLSATYAKLNGANMTGNLTFATQVTGIGFGATVSNSSTPTFATSGNYITAGSDYAGLGKLNSVAVQTWYGFSISPTISGQTIAQGTPAFSVDARTGNMYVAGNSNLNGGATITKDWGNLTLASTTAGTDPELFFNSPGGSWSIRNDDSDGNDFEWRWNNSHIASFRTDGSADFASKVLISGGDDVSLTGNGYLQLGTTSAYNIVIDVNEMQARNNGAASNLNLNPNGGTTTFGGDIQLLADTTIRMGGYETIQFKSGPDANGRGVIIGSGGTTVIASGESNAYFRDGWGPGNNWGIENIYMAADNGIYFLTGQNAGYSYVPSMTMYSTNRTTAKPQFNPSGKEEEIKTFYDSGSGAVDSSGYTTITTGGWYTIAYNGSTTTPGTGSGGNRAFAKFTCMDMSSGNHHLIQFTAGTAYNNAAGCNIVQLANVKYGATNEIFGGVRILTGGTYDTQYLQVYVSPNNIVRFIMEDNYWTSGWVPLNWSSSPVGSTIPTGYVDNKMELQGGFLNRPQNLLSGTASPPSQGAFPGDVYIQY
jgi:hypothetical protein